MRLIKRWITSSLLALSLLTASATAADLSGRVRDTSTNSYLFGASVTILELNRTETSAAGGGFSFSDVPAGPYTLVVKYLGYTDESRTVTVDSENQNLDIGIDSALNTVTLNGQLIGLPSEKGNRGIAMDSVLTTMNTSPVADPSMQGSLIGSTPRLTVFGEFLNINEEPLLNYHGVRNRSVGNEIYSWNANDGINFSL